MNDQPAQSRPLPQHERHRRTLLAAIAVESAHEQAAGRPAQSAAPASPRAWSRRLSAVAETEPSPRLGWLKPAMAAAAVLAVAVAGIGLHALLRQARQPGQPGQPGTAAVRSSAGPQPSALGGGEWSVTRKYTVTAPVANLIVTGTAGSVSVTSGSGSAVSVTATSYYRTSQPSISDKISGRTLALGYSACADCGVAFSVTVPRAVSVTINEHTGKVTIANLAGDVSVNDDAGAVAMAGLTGDVSVQNGSGTINGTGLSAARASFRDRNGMIDVAFITPPRQLSAVSGTGVVSIRVPSGTTYRVSAGSQLGPVHVSVPQSPAATHVITATASIGTVSVSTG